MFLPSKHLLSAFYKTLPSKNPSKNPVFTEKHLQALSKNPSKKHLQVENLLRTLLRSMRLHDPLGVHPKFFKLAGDSWRSRSQKGSENAATSGKNVGEVEVAGHRLQLLGSEPEGVMREPTLLRRGFRRFCSMPQRRVLRRVLRRCLAEGFTVKTVLRGFSEKGFPEGA